MNNRTILFVHGLGADYRQFEKQHDFFSDDFKVISVSIRGHGCVSAATSYKMQDFNLGDIAEDIILLLKSLSIDSAHFVGNSMGGNIGFEIIQKHPSYLLSLTTFGTTAKLKKSAFLTRILTLTYKMLGTKPIAYLAGRSGMTSYSRAMIRKMMASTSKSTFLCALPNLSNFNYLPVIRDSNIPILIIRGDRDTSINKEMDSTLTELGLRGNFQLKNIKNAGHFVNLDHPTIFNYVLRDFIGFVEKKQRGQSPYLSLAGTSSKN